MADKQPWTKILIEGREPFEIPYEYRDNDAMIVAALAPIYPQAADAEIRRETLAGEDMLVHITPANKADQDSRNMGIHIAPRGKTKGAGPHVAFADILNAAPRYRNPVVALAHELEAVQPITEQVMFDYIERITEVTASATEVLAYTKQLTDRLDKVVEHQPSKHVPLGF